MEMLALKDVGIALLDCEHKTPSSSLKGFPYISIPQLKNGVIDISDARRISYNDFLDWTKKVLPQEYDVILSRRCNPGETAVVPRGMSCALGQNLVILRSNGKYIYPPFLRWITRSRQWWLEVNKYINVGAVFESLRCSDIVNFKIPVLPLLEQQAIAHILGTLDDKIELNRRQNATLEAMAQAIFKEWFVDFGPVRAKMEGRQPECMSREIADLFPDRLDSEGKPEGWEWAVLSDCCEINPKRVLQKNKYASYLDMSNMPTTNALPHKWNMRNFTSGMKFMNGDTLIARITPCLENGKTAFVDFLKNDEVGWGSTEYIVLRPKSNISPFWGYLLSKTDEFRKFAIQSMTGTSGRQRVQVDQLADFQIAKAPGTIHNILRIQFDSIVRKLSKNRNEANILIDIRDTLLPKLISGELRVPDAEKMVADIV